MKRFLGPILSLVVLAAVAIAIFSSSGGTPFNKTVINGVGGSEKRPFFVDPRVQKRFRQLGYEVNYRKAGSRQIATTVDLGQYDFAFPAGVPAAEKIRRNFPSSKMNSPFFTPMAVASWQSIADMLVAQGIAEDKGGYYTLDMKRYLALVAAKKRWSDLPNNKAYPVNKPILINSTDVRKSNSAAMYLALASYVLNDNAVPNTQQAAKIIEPLTALFVRQGFTESSSAGPFQDYMVMGMGKAPMVMVYESQFIHQAALPNGGIRPGMVLMYPSPSLFTKHSFVAFNDQAAELGRLLETDPELQKLANEHGLRNANFGYFKQFTQQKGIKIADQLLNVVEPPSYETIERMILSIERAY